MKHLRQYIRGILAEGIQTQRLHHSRGSGYIDAGPHRQPSVSDQLGPAKPDGIWYDCGGQWKEFCEVELGSYPNRGYDTVYEVFPNEATVLFITTLQEFADFENEYLKLGKYEKVIDWKRLSEKYHGIEICPYQRTRRMESSWYYPWDVASGCIWNPAGIKEMKKRC
jgi:hypothetical protein